MKELQAKQDKELLKEMQPTLDELKKNLWNGFILTSLIN